MIQRQAQAKSAALAVLHSLPEDSSWDDVQYRLYVRQQIDAGLADEEAGRMIDTEQLRQRLDAHKQRLRTE